MHCSQQRKPGAEADRGEGSNRSGLWWKPLKDDRSCDSNAPV
jgi:hypothetical protein